MQLAFRWPLWLRGRPSSKSKPCSLILSERASMTSSPIRRQATTRPAATAREGLAACYDVVVASKNPAKIRSVDLALKQCFPQHSFSIHPTSAESGVPDQPVGADETLRGALNRVKHASSSLPSASLTISIEGGVEWLGEDLHCFAWAVVQSSSTGAISKARSASFMLPDKIRQLVKQGMELGDADDRVFGRTKSGQGSGTVGMLTGGLITRSSYYEHTIMLALAPFMNPKLYPDYVLGPVCNGADAF